MSVQSAEHFRVRQRSDLTFKHNITANRHGWLRLTPAYSVKIVEQILSEYTDSVSVFDPFSGTATTPLCAAAHGHSSVSVDINPFLVWFGRAKIAHYHDDILVRTRDIGSEIHEIVQSGSMPPVAAPPIANIRRWWDECHLVYLCKIKSAIDSYHTEPDTVQDLLKIAFCKTLIQLSNASFNHQSMSFKDKAKNNNQQQLWTDDFLGVDSFIENLELVLSSAGLNLSGNAEVMLGDSRSLDFLDNEQFGLLITSPPYPNRMSYIRELRPYMYWLSYLNEAREAGELDWQAIGGTWGIATSRLNTWEPSRTSYYPDNLLLIIEEVAKSDSKSGSVLANYIGKYFEDMWLHFDSVRLHMKSGSKVHYIVGNSKFYDSLVPVEKFYADMLERAGFEQVRIEVIRKRNSKKELFEFDVTGIA